MSDNYIFKLRILDGRGFGDTPQALLCSAVFAGEAKSTQYSVSGDWHTWNSTLTWSLNREELRKAQAKGASHCKISVLRKDGVHLGWVVISLRSAKLQSQYKSDPQGQWLQLNATKAADPPQLRAAYSLYDERSLLQKESSSSSVASTVNTTAVGRHSSNRRHSSGNNSLRPNRVTSCRMSDVSAGNSNLAEEIGSLQEAASASPQAVVMHDTAASNAPMDVEVIELSAVADADNTSSQQNVAADGASSPSSVAAQVSGPHRQHQVQQSSLHGVAEQRQDGQQQKQKHHQQAQKQQETQQAAQEVQPQTGCQLQPLQTAISNTDLQSISQCCSQEQMDVHNVSAATGAAAGLDGTVAIAGKQRQQQHPAAVGAAGTAAAGPGHEQHPGEGASTTAVASTAAGELLAAVEAALPTLAQRRRQQQLQQVQQQAATDVAAADEAGTGVPGASGSKANTAAAEAPVAKMASEASAAPPAGEGIETAGHHAQHTAAAMSNTAYLSGADSSSHSAADVSNTVVAVDAAQPSTAANAAVANGDVDVAAADAIDPVRAFQLTLDIRSFQAGRKLPLAIASTYVQAFLPQEVLGFLTGQCGAKLPPRLTPIRTYPTVDVLRGSESGLPNGCASVGFAAGVMALAGLLAQAPRVVLEVWHKEKLRSDLLLGVASVPLSALLQECWVDGHAPVYAMMAKAGSATTGSDAQQEKVQVGLLRVILSLEDKGPAAAVSAALPAETQQHCRSSSSPRTPLDMGPLAVTPHKQQQLQRGLVDRPYSQRQQQLQQGLRVAGANPAAGAVPAGHYKQQQQVQQQASTVITCQTSAGRQQAQRSSVGAQGLAAVAATASDVTTDQPHVGDAAASSAHDFPHMPEYQVTWELEVWKKAEETRFRAQLQELEQQRMAVIEGQWWKRERVREAEIAAIKAQYAKLEQETRALLASMQERESRIVSAEAELRRRTADLERQQAVRMAEAEAAVRRLQVECEHQLALERDRTVAVAKQRDAAEARLLAAEARAAAMEAQFTEYRAAQHQTPEAKLQAQLDEAQRAAATAENKAAKALKTKKHYKQQVLQLARELAALQQQHQAELIQQQQQAAAAVAAKQHSSRAAKQQAQLASLREQLAEMKAAALAAATAADTCSPVSSPCSSKSVGWHGQHKHEQRQLRHSSRGKENRQRQGSRREPHHRHRAHLHQQQQLQQQESWQGFDSDNASDYGITSSMHIDEEASFADQHMRHSNNSVHRARRHKGVKASFRASGSAAAEAALAEVAALAAILNQPKATASAAATAENPSPQQEKDASNVALQQDTVPKAASEHDMPDQHGSVVVLGSSNSQRATALAAETAAEVAQTSKLQTPQQPLRHSCELVGNPLSKVRRLLKEKVELLSSGLYGREDPVILQIDARVESLAEQQLSAAG